MAANVKILIISQYWAPENGVPQRRWTWLSRILADAGHDVTVIAPPPHYQRKMSFRSWWKTRHSRRYQGVERGPANERIIRTGFIPSGQSITQKILNQATVALGALWIVARREGVLRNYSPDLVIGTVPALPTAPVTYLIAKVFRSRYTLDLRDAWPDLLAETANWNRSVGKPSLRERILSKGPLQILVAVTRWALNYSIDRASGVIVTSSELEKELHLRASCRKRKTPFRSSVVRNVFPPQSSDNFTENEKISPPGTLNVLYAGTVGRAQNLSNAVAAVEIANQLGATVNLRIVGAGAAKRQVIQESLSRSINVEFFPSQDAAGLDTHYKWAGTALVHLTDWPALNSAVPSKTYELMDLGIHITAVVDGEAAQIVQKYEAGTVIKPEEPQRLAEFWKAAADNPQLLRVSDRGKEWVNRQRNEEAPARLLDIIEGSCD